MSGVSSTNEDPSILLARRCMIPGWHVFCWDLLWSRLIWLCESGFALKWDNFYGRVLFMRWQKSHNIYHMTKPYKN